MLVVDSQIHLFESSRTESAIRRGHRVRSAEEVVVAMDAAEIARAYIVPTEYIANETCLLARAQWPARFRVMGLIAVDKSESQDLVASWSSTGMLGVRLRFRPTTREETWLSDGTVDWFWPAAQEAGIPVMVWPPGQLEAMAEVAARFPGLRFTIDHLGLFIDDLDDDVDEVVERLLPLARLGNVAVKASALPCHTTEAYPFRNLYGAIRRVVDAFGPARVFWGSDLSRIGSSYEEARNFFLEAVDFLSAVEIDQVMGAAILDWVGW